MENTSEGSIGIDPIIIRQTKACIRAGTLGVCKNVADNAKSLRCILNGSWKTVTLRRGGVPNITALTHASYTV